MAKKDWLNKYMTEQERLWPLHPMYYECDFYNSSSTWYKPEYFQYGDYEEDM
ncbi:MAG: hypothetical protein OES15_03020 [Nitrosopumilus sp.]|nr:hypothetical protein [Nitrosopumilus sp.]